MLPTTIPKVFFYRVARINKKAEEVVIQLISSKGMPILLYGLEAYALNKSDIRSIDFVLNRFCMKLRLMT